MWRGRAIVRVHLLVAIAAVVAVCGGCASGTGQAGSTTDVPGSQAAAPGTAQNGAQNGDSAVIGYERCPDTATDPAILKLRAQPAMVQLPADFHAVAAVRCVTQDRTVPGDGKWQFSDAQRTDSGLDALLTALKLPSTTAPPGSQIACAAVGIALPPFALVSVSGAIVDPVLPHDICGMPLHQVLDAINALPWRTETEQKVTQIETQAELDTNCAPAYKDQFELPVLHSPTPWSEVRAPFTPGPITACLYTVLPGTGSISETTFERGLKLDSSQESAVTQALASMDGKTPAPACTTAATRFVEFSGGELNGAMLEFDGCHRVRWPNGFMEKGSESFIQALAAIGIS